MVSRRRATEDGQHDGHTDQARRTAVLRRPVDTCLVGHEAREEPPEQRGGPESREDDGGGDGVHSQDDGPLDGVAVVRGDASTRGQGGRGEHEESTLLQQRRVQRVVYRPRDRGQCPAAPGTNGCVVLATLCVIETRGHLC